jgi:hypothetical protein
MTSSGNEPATFLLVVQCSINCTRGHIKNMKPSRMCDEYRLIMERVTLIFRTNLHGKIYNKTFNLSGIM